MSELEIGIYERLLDTELSGALASSPELKSILRKIDDEAAPHTYSQFIAQLLQQALRITKTEARIPLLNQIIDLLSATDGLEYLERNRLLSDSKNLLTEVNQSTVALPRPQTPLTTSALLTGLGNDPALEHELRAEMATADRVDILVSFIKWSGLRLLRPSFEKLAERGIPIRILSTSYMGASDPVALEWLSKLPNVDVRLSYDTGGTRLHAKAYHFIRKSGYSTAYIGSSNLTHSAQVTGMEWNVRVSGLRNPDVIRKMGSVFEAYWEGEDFRTFNRSEFVEETERTKITGPSIILSPIELRLEPFQERLLEQINVSRRQGHHKNLLVAATGTGKTYLSAFDAKKFKPNKFLFVVHRANIAKAAMETYRAVFGVEKSIGMYSGVRRELDKDFIFST